MHSSEIIFKIETFQHKKDVFKMFISKMTVIPPTRQCVKVRVALILFKHHNQIYSNMRKFCRQINCYIAWILIRYGVEMPYHVRNLGHYRFR